VFKDPVSILILLHPAGVRCANTYELYQMGGELHGELQHAALLRGRALWLAATTVYRPPAKHALRQRGLSLRLVLWKDGATIVLVS